MQLYSRPEDDANDGWIASIHTTPLAGVMLALLILILVTAPFLSGNVPVALPAESAEMPATSSNHVMINVDKAGNLYLGDTFAPSLQVLSTLMESIARSEPQPELHIRADAQTHFEHVGQVIATAQGHGFASVSLATQPAQK